MVHFKTVDDAISFIHSRPNTGHKVSLERMYTLLKALGNPNEKLPPAIHVAGTNGKGSVSTMCSYILAAQNKRVGLFVSPFIIDFRERIQINNQFIEPEDLRQVTEDVANVLKQVDEKLYPDIPVEFEVLTAIALTYFSQQSLDALVVEVGIGGKYDSTNVLSQAKVAVITSIGFDHMKMLGDTIPKIAQQKAGIIHNGMRVVIGKLPESAQQVISEVSDQPPISGKINEFDATLPGEFQHMNTATAVAAVRAYDATIDDAIIRRGLDMVTIPARYEIVKQAPITILDGAHNAQGIEQLVLSLRYQFPNQKITLIIGSLADKNVADTFTNILSHTNFRLILVPFVGPNGRHGLDIQKILVQHQQNQRLISFDSWQTAYQHIGHDEVVALTGSLYFVSEVRKLLK